MTSLNAALPQKNNDIVLVAAIEPLYTSETSPKAGVFYNFDTSNVATYHEQLATCNTYVSTSIDKYAYTLTNGMKFDGKNKKAKKAVEDAIEKNNFLNQIQTMARYLCIYGGYGATTIGKGSTFQAKPILPAALTILPSGVTHGSSVKYIMEPPISKFIINEGSTSSEIEEVTLDPKDVVYCAINPYGAVQKDRLNRKTRGFYGQSQLDPLVPAIRALLDINKGQTEFYKKYGNGYRYYRFTLLEELVKAGKITLEKAQIAMNEFIENHKNFSANEDLITYGIEVQRIDAAGSLDVMQFKAALETEIMIGLYQSPLTMGQSFQTTYASSYMVEEDRMKVLESHQKILKTGAQQLLNKLSVSMGFREDLVTVEFDELSKIKLDPQLVIELANNGWIVKKQLLDYCGFEDQSDDSTQGSPILTTKQPEQITQPLVTQE